MEPKVIEISSRVRIVETSSDGAWLDGYAVEWEPKPEENWIRVALPIGAELPDAKAVALAFNSALRKAEVASDA